MKIAYLDTEFVPLNKARISILDRGFLYGDGAFETMHAYGGIVFRLEKHIDRLFGSLKALRIFLGTDKPKIQKIIYKLLDKNRLNNAYIKVIVTRGSSAGLLIPSETRRATLAIYALPYRAHSQNVYKKGITAFTARTRYNEKSEVAGKKTLNYLNNILCRSEAKSRGFDDAVFLNTEGFIVEATSSNIFLISKKKIFTPSLKSGCLPGITRDEVIRIAGSALKKPVEGALMKRSVLYSADEIFLTNSLTGIVPVRKVDNHAVGKSAPGPITEILTGLFKRSVKRYCAKYCANKIDKKNFL